MNAKELYAAYGLGKAAGPSKNPEEYSYIIDALERTMAPSQKGSLCVLKANFANRIAGAADFESACGSAVTLTEALQDLEGNDSELAYVYVRKVGMSKDSAKALLSSVPNWAEKPAKAEPKPKPNPGKKKTPAKEPDPKTPAYVPVAVAAKPSAVNAKTVLIGVGLLLAAIGVGTLAMRSMRVA